MNPFTEAVIKRRIARTEDELLRGQHRRTELLRSLGSESLHIARCEEELSALQADLFGHDGRHFTPEVAPRMVIRGGSEVRDLGSAEPLRQ